MIEGAVNARRQAVIPLTVLGPRGRTRDIEAVIDTGFTGFLTLPLALVEELGLAFRSTGEVVLGDGSRIAVRSYDVAVLWEGDPKPGFVEDAETTPLVGMEMLDDHHLHVEVAVGGRVAIEAR